MKAMAFVTVIFYSKIKAGMADGATSKNYWR